MRLLLVSLLLAILTACSAGPRLEQPSAVFPQDLQFAGTWDRIDTQVDDRMRSGSPGLVIPRNQRLAVSTENRKEPGMLARSDGC